MNNCAQRPDNSPALAPELEHRLHHLERELEQYRQREREMLSQQAATAAGYRAKSALLAHVSHEIRSLIQLTTGAVDLLRQTELNRQQEEYLTAFQHANRQLLSLTDDILDVAKIEAGRFQLDEITYSLDDLLAGSISIFTWEAEKKGLRFDVQLPPDVPRRLRGDPKRLRQVLTNLIGNAIKFTAAGSILLKIESAAGMLRFTVTDTGIGIPPDKVREIFDSFVQGSPATARLHGGTGLGLAIARELVAMMGGEIRVESREGSGSTFTFTIPAAPGEGAEHSALPTVAASVPPTAGRKLSILLAEDSAEIRLLLGAFLGRAAHTVDFAVDGAQAVAMATSKRYDVVLMDLQMPVLDGYRATRAIRDWERDQGAPQVPILALTASVERSDCRRCREAGCSGQLAKPIRQEALLQALCDVTAQGLIPAGPAR